MWTIPLGGGRLEQPFSLGGSGSGYIYGYCDSKYREDMTRCVGFRSSFMIAAVRWAASATSLLLLLSLICLHRAECEEFVKNAVALAMSRDGHSGGVVRICTINEVSMM